MTSNAQASSRQFVSPDVENRACREPTAVGVGRIEARLLNEEAGT